MSLDVSMSWQPERLNPKWTSAKSLHSVNPEIWEVITRPAFIFAIYPVDVFSINPMILDDLCFDKRFYQKNVK